MLDELKDILSELYYQYGITKSIVRLSQLIDVLVYQEQVKNR